LGLTPEYSAVDARTTEEVLGRLSTVLFGLVVLGAAVASWWAPCPDWLRWTSLLLFGSIGSFIIGVSLTASHGKMAQLMAELRRSALEELTLGLYKPGRANPVPIPHEQETESGS